MISEKNDYSHPIYVYQAKEMRKGEPAGPSFLINKSIKEINENSLWLQYSGIL